ncbi:uncharacterized protein SPSK_10068 [Sporothrix schenckii 1099-18]|uniref:Uncharacterized protein n=1 Tax=Sporothrix schenckii 1099-18 TaxID=1397361 RepID=A0A0F2M739_SPOSC|nr:uncharacterized protein SPSK_10068 [Sporothrix schenckii 1099-18]KJR85437.1 hypothetical protein SPSK_10068 [Sporothrix schenckii 1099-18]
MSRVWEYRRKTRPRAHKVVESGTANESRGQIESSSPLSTENSPILINCWEKDRGRQTLICQGWPTLSCVIPSRGLAVPEGFVAQHFGYAARELGSAWLLVLGRMAQRRQMLLMAM